MNDVVQFATTVIEFLIDLFTLGLIGTIFYVIGTAIVTMARNKSPRWDTIGYTLVILLLALWLVQWYPKQVIRAMRVGLEESRPEAVQLRSELELWLPNLPTPPSGAATIAPVDAETGQLFPGEAENTPVPNLSYVEPLPTDTPTPTATTEGITPISTATATVPPTATVTPSPTATRWPPVPPVTPHSATPPIPTPPVLFP